MIWDGSPIHRSRVVRDFLAAGGARRIQLERLPGYAPDLNPDEGIWAYLKHVELRNVCSLTIDQLQAEVLRAKKRLQRKRRVVQACFEGAGLI